MTVHGYTCVVPAMTQAGDYVAAIHGSDYLMLYAESEVLVSSAVKFWVQAMCIVI